MLRHFPSLLAALALAAPAVAAPSLLVAGPPEAPLRLRVDAAGARVETARFTATIALAPGAGIDGFVATAGGWLAVGSVPVAGGRELALWTEGEPKATALPPPPGRRGAVRDSPVPLLQGGELVGLAWLEGESAGRFAVWVSPWDGRQWGKSVVVGPPGPGSQLALTGAVLADGSWVLAWSAFDGEDDEVIWSAGRRGRWSPPRPVAADNHVPDVTPSLRADGDGGLLAWSRYDGNDYRLLISRLSGDRWQAPHWAAGAGSAFPQWQGETLVYRDASQGAWVASSVDATDRLRVETAIAAPAEPRPAVLRDATKGGRLRLLFP